MKLWDIAHSRTGDKGNISNISLIAYDPKDYELLREKVTAEKVKEHFKGMVKGEVVRYELPNIHALNFVMYAALGGGVTGDIAGFAAATFLRGVPLFQIPTTLLAQVDSSVGGKTGVDLPEGKNLVGAFHEPAAVLVDLEVLETLPTAEIIAGSAEIIKAGFIRDPRILEIYEADPAAALDPKGSLPELIEAAVRVKAEVVGQDLRESSLREILNYGHTYGHAVEQHENYIWCHGHAVAVGMVLAARGAERLGYSPAGTLETVLEANERLGLPSRCPYGAQALYEAATGDKKRGGDHIDVVVLEEIGRAGTVRLDMAGLRAFTEAAVWI